MSNVGINSNQHNQHHMSEMADTGPHKPLSKNVWFGFVLCFAVRTLSVPLATCIHGVWTGQVRDCTSDSGENLGNFCFSEVALELSVLWYPSNSSQRKEFKAKVKYFHFHLWVGSQEN